MVSVTCKTGALITSEIVRHVPHSYGKKEIGYHKKRERRADLRAIGGDGGAGDE